MNYGVYGGAFDPFHDGHMSVIEAAISSNKMDRLIVVPTGTPVFKQNRALSPASYRFYMVKEALEAFPMCSVSPVEILSKERSYSLETLRILIEKEQISTEDKIYLIIGSDLLYDFPKWHMPEEILRLATLLVAIRPSYDDEKFRLRCVEIEEYYDTEVDFLPVEAVDISSSVIRKTRDFSQVPQIVHSFILRNDLYPIDQPLNHVSDRAYEQFMDYARILFSELSEKRLLHSLNTAILCVRYAVRFGEDPNAALLAGLLHDCAKELPDDQKRALADKIDQGLSRNVELIHAPAGACYAREHFNVHEEEVLNAIAAHTTGCAHMTGIDKIVYLADKLEPSRHYDDLQEIRSRVEKDLDDAMIACLRAVQNSMKKKGKSFHKDAQDALNKLIVKQKIKAKKEAKMNSKKTSEIISTILIEKKAVNVEIVSVMKKTVIADYFVVASGTSTTHVKALANEVAFVLKEKHHLSPERIEGASTSRWVLIDYKDVIVHIFHPEERENYSLEKLWETRPEDPNIDAPSSTTKDELLD